MEEPLLIDKPKRPFFKRLARFFLWLILLLVFSMASLLGLLIVYEDEVKAAIVSELNKYLKAEVKIDPKNIDLTIIKSFPDCSIEFKNMLMLEALPVKKRDTLIFAGQLNLHFNIKDLWQKNYEIKKIKLKDAILKPRILKDGTNNYEFWKRSEKKASAAKDSMRFNLKLISIENCRLDFKNRKSLFKTLVQIKRLDFKGKFSDENFEMESDANLLISELVHGQTHYLRDKNFDFSLKLDVSDKEYTIKKAALNLNKLGFELNGNVVFSDSLERMDLKYNTPDLDIAAVMSLLPERFKENIGDYKSAGNFYAGGTIRFLNKNTYSVISDFGIRSGEVTYKPNSAVATNVNMEGYLNYSNSGSVLNLKNIHLNLNSDEIAGNCLINNFEDPYLRLKANASVKLQNLFNFWPVDTIRQLKGDLKINTEIEGLLTALKDQTFSEKVKLDLQAAVSGLEVQFKHDEKLYSIENCGISAKEREIEVRDLKLKRGSSDITVSGKIPGVFNYILDKNAPLIISGNLYSNYIRLEDFMSQTKASSSSEGSNGPLIPANINFKLNAAILKFSFGKFEANVITGEIEIKKQKAMISDVKLQTMQGEAEINILADNSKNKLDVSMQSNLKNINITELFSELNNFGQTALTEKHLKGSASATVEFSGSWSNKLVADLSSIRSSCDLNIQRGELNDFKPLLNLSKFVDVEELKQIRFSSLNSSVQIRNNMITIPRTSIKNSALDIEVWGTHTFDNKIDYHIQLLISHLLAKKRKNKDSEFGPVENDPDDRRSAFILMTGTMDDPHTRYDTKGQKEKIRNDIQAEKKNMKQVLKEEWNLFKKDSTVKKHKKPETVFELEQAEKPASKKTLEPKKKKEEDEDF